VKTLRERAAAMGVSLSLEQVELFETYYEHLIDWNQRLNLTTVTEYQQVQIKHFLDSLSCLSLLDAVVSSRGWKPSPRLLDIGSGAGFPGLPLKIARPRWDVTLLDSSGKKVAFLVHLIGRLGLQGVRATKGRAEDMGRDPQHREMYNIVAARAVAELPILMEYALPLCQVGGVFLALKGKDITNELTESETALKELGGGFLQARAIDLPTLDSPRHLILIEKLSPTSARYPRRPGIPSKRPLKVAISPTEE
jgi:16S rRNA (guanine527-N7)-methyltransferase